MSFLTRFFLSPFSSRVHRVSYVNCACTLLRWGCLCYNFDNRIRYPTPDYQVGDQLLVNREAALRSEEKTDKDRVNNQLAPRNEGPFPVVQVDGHTVTIIRGMGLKDWLSRDRVVKSPPLRSNVEDTQPDPAVSDGEDGNFPEATPSEGTLATPASATSRTPGLMNAVAGGATEEALSRLAGFRSQIRGNCTVPADHPPTSGARPPTKDSRRGEASDTRPATRSPTVRETHIAPESPVARTDPPAPRRLGASASSAIDPAHRAFVTSGAARLAAKCTFQIDAFRAPLPSPSTESLPPDV